MNYYDSVAQKYLFENPPPGKLTIEAVQYLSEPGMVFLRLFRDEINSKPTHFADELRDWLQKTLDDLNRSLSIGKFSWELYPPEAGE